MSASDHDMSESSYSPQSSNSESPYSSPSQQVPQLVNFLTELSCTEPQLQPNNVNQPYLRILEQPQNHFRFRYISEMVGTHGCLLGQSYASNKTKTHPTVELVNYTGQALISCRLAQANNPDEHPHKLLENDQDRDVSCMVPERGSYKVAFAGMGIIHTAKKNVSNWLAKKISGTNPGTNAKELKSQADNLAKNINLNIVRLRFSAQDVKTGKEICAPVFSEPIHNMKSAATNDLKICRMSRHTGRPSGGEDVFILVEKVNKKNIMVRFYELSPNGEMSWSAHGNFLQTDVHHQYAIVFRTPKYHDLQIGRDVSVYVELVRPSDGRTSVPVEFTYKANQVYRQIKKRKVNSSYSSLESSSGGSIKSFSDVPATVTLLNQDDTIKRDAEMSLYSNPQHVISQGSPSSNQCDLANALASGLQADTQHLTNPTWGQQKAVPVTIISQIPNLQMNSTEFEKMFNADIESDDKRITSGAEWIQEYLKSFNDILPDENGSIDFPSDANFIADSGVKKEISPNKSGQNITKEEKSADSRKSNTDYPAYYTAEDGSDVKQLVKEICEIMRNKNGYKKQEVREKFERLFAIRLSNGDTFLHMTLCSNQQSFEYIVKMIHSVKMNHLLNATNDKQQTILHLAIANDLPKVVTLLISKGCNPMLKDIEDHNAVHYAVKSENCLEPLLDAIKKYDVPCDLNAVNSERQSALHLAALLNSSLGCSALLRHGARSEARDAHARTPLHLAAYDDKPAALRALLRAAQDVDARDGRGNSALQIVCGGAPRPHSARIARLLLEHNADAQRALHLVDDKPELRDILKEYLAEKQVDEIKSEPEDEYESADDGESEVSGGRLRALSQYVGGVARVLDASGAWRELARRLHLDALLAWYSAQPSPARTLLAHLEECNEDITSKSLALMLDEMGQKDASRIIRQYID